MYFNCKIEVVIAGKLLTTVHSVSIKNDIRSIGSFATLVVPLNCRIQYQDNKTSFLTDFARNLFKSGDEITIKAWYEGMEVLTVYNGFVYDFQEGNPTEIKCQDNIYLLNLATLNLSYRSVTLTALINKILEGTGITLMQPSIDMNLVDITFTLMSPAAILEYFKKNLGLHISFVGKQLYVNLASNVSNTVKYSTDRNIIISNLQKPDAVFRKIKIKAWFIQENGIKDSLEVGDPNGQLEEVYFFKVKRDLALYKKLAGEALTKYTQLKYSGNVETYLYPVCDLFWAADYTDISYPARSATYYIISHDIDLNENGYHRKLKFSFLNE